MIFAWGGTTNPMVRIADRFRDKDQKKGLRSKILRFVVMFTRVYVPKRNFTHTWGAETVFWGHSA